MPVITYDPEGELMNSFRQGGLSAPSLRSTLSRIARILPWKLRFRSGREAIADIRAAQILQNVLGQAVGPGLIAPRAPQFEAISRLIPFAKPGFVFSSDADRASHILPGLQSFFGQFSRSLEPYPGHFDAGKLKKMPVDVLKYRIFEDVEPRLRANLIVNNTLTNLMPSLTPAGLPLGSLAELANVNKEIQKIQPKWSGGLVIKPKSKPTSKPEPKTKPDTEIKSDHPDFMGRVKSWLRNIPEPLQAVLAGLGVGALSGAARWTGNSFERLAIGAKRPGLKDLLHDTLHGAAILGPGFGLGYGGLRLADVVSKRYGYNRNWLRAVAGITGLLGGAYSGVRIAELLGIQPSRLYNSSGEEEEEDSKPKKFKKK